MRRFSRLSCSAIVSALRGGAMPTVIAVAVSCGVSAVGCGDDDSDDDNGAADGGVRPRIDAGPVGDGPGDEGWPCTSTDPCNGDLRCATTPFTLGGEVVGVCAVACDDETDCGDGNQCISYTGDAADAHCVNVVEDEYEVCGVADTSVCSDELTCLYFPDLPVGVCVSICNTEGGGEQDAGTDEPNTVAMCSGDQTCIEGILAMPEPGEGVCGTLVQRGELCGLDFGLYCPEGDVCAPEDPEDESSDARCYQDCSTETGAECDEGACTLVPGLFAYCLP
jgi:hypothetical protein